MGGHSPDRQENVPGLEQLSQELLGITTIFAQHDRLLQPPGLLGEAGDKIKFASDEGGHDPPRQSEWRADLQVFSSIWRSTFSVSILATAGSTGRVERAVNGDEVVRPDELVQLYVVHMAALTYLRCVEDHEGVIGIDVRLSGHRAGWRKGRLPRTLARVRFMATIDIAARAQLVYEVYTDVERWPEWAASVTSVERLDQGPLRVGSRARIKQPRLPTTVWEVTEVVAGRSFTWILA